MSVGGVVGCGWMDDFWDLLFFLTKVPNGLCVKDGKPVDGGGAARVCLGRLVLNRDCCCCWKEDTATLRSLMEPINGFMVVVVVVVVVVGVVVVVVVVVVVTRGLARRIVAAGLSPIGVFMRRSKKADRFRRPVVLPTFGDNSPGKTSSASPSVLAMAMKMKILWWTRFGGNRKKQERVCIG